MPVGEPNLEPPFNVVRASHVAFGVRDLNRARAFYVDCLGLLETARDGDTLYLRGVEERNHHSLVLRQARAAEIHALGFKLAGEADLDHAAAWFARRNLPVVFPDVPHQGRTLRTADPFGIRSNSMREWIRSHRCSSAMRSIEARASSASTTSIASRPTSRRATISTPRSDSGLP